MSTLHQNLEFHNVHALEPIDGGVLLTRYPTEVRHHLSDRGRFVSMESTGVEIRFVCPSPNIRLFLSHLEADSEVTVYRGDFLVSRHPVPMGRRTCLHLTTPERFAWVRPEALKGAFSKDVWRICFNRATGIFHGIDSFGAELRPPRADEKPARRYLAYGSSITHGHLLSYVFQAARLLKADVMNKGLSGACAVEAQTADFLRDKVDYDFATLELGVNIRDGQVSPAEFESRCRYMVVRLLEKNPGKPLFLITIFPNFDDWREAGKETTGTRNDLAFSEALRKIQSDLRHPKLHLIEGSEVLVNAGGLSQDLIHPGEFGQVEMGMNLARLMESKLRGS